MAWLKLQQGVHRNRKIMVLARTLAISRMTAVGHMTSLWLWALDNAQDGDISVLGDNEVAMAAEWPEETAGEFLAAICDAGLIDPDGKIHDWYDYAGVLIDRRRTEAARKRNERARMSAGQAQDGTQEDTPGTERPATAPAGQGAGRPAVKRRVEQSREEQTPAGDNRPAPPWILELEGIQGFKKDQHQEDLLRTWVAERGHSDELMLKVAEAMVSKVKAKQYINNYAAVKTWTRREVEGWNGRNNQATAGSGSGQSPQIRH